MERWGLEGMRSFEQKGVKAKERARDKIPDEVSTYTWLPAPQPR